MTEKTSGLFRLILPYLCIMVLTVSAMIMLLLQTLNAAGQEYAQVVTDQVRYHWGQLDDAITHTDDMLMAGAANDPDLIAMAWCDNPDVFMLYQYRVLKNYSRQTYRSSVVGCYFFHTEKFDNYLQVNQSESDYSFRTQAAEKVKATIAAGELHAGWNALSAGGETILVRALDVQQMTLGYWIRADAFLGTLAKQTDPVRYSLLMGDGQQLCTSGTIGTGKAISYTLSSSTGTFHILAEINRMSTLQQMDTRQRAVIVLCILIVNACVLWFLGSYLQTIRPMNRLLKTMGRIMNGDMQARTTEMPHASKEIKLLCHTFDAMMDQISELQNRSFTQQLRIKSSEMERLQLQINPHFFINALNGIRSYAMLRNFKAINEMSLYLADYYRFVLRPGIMVLPLAEEMAHTENYIHIQQMRFADRLCYETDVDEAILQALVPVLMIHTFVDNAVQHAMGSSTVLIRVTGRLLENDLVQLIVEDSGSGFSPEILSRLNQSERLTDEQGNHVGLWNLKERIDDLYEGKASMRFENKLEGGARIALRFPFQKAR